jgi:hypothetical protein
VVHVGGAALHAEAGRTPGVPIPRFTHSCMTCQIRRSPARTSASERTAALVREHDVADWSGRCSRADLQELGAGRERIRNVGPLWGLVFRWPPVACSSTDEPATDGVIHARSQRRALGHRSP